MRLIDGDAIIIDLLDHGIEGVQTDDYAEFQQIVADAPTVDAVPVTRCQYCKWWNEKLWACMDREHGFASSDPDFFCADGKPKEGDER